MFPFEEALRVTRAIPAPMRAAQATEALPERVRDLESENTILKAALAFLRGGSRERRQPLRNRAEYARKRRTRLKADRLAGLLHEAVA
jgi:hypothetical protein